MVASSLNMLVNNDIVEDLTPNPSTILFPEGAATSWCQPGRSVWDWLNPQPGGRTAANAIINNDYASQLGYEYNTIDDGWESWNGGNPWPHVQSVVSDANNRNVRILLWKRSSELSTSSQRSAFFQQLRNYGVAGFKADFFDFNGVSAGSRERVQLMRDILRDAAGYQLVANFHGTSKGSSLSVTAANEGGVIARFVPQ
jgi:alpha-glucosidase